MKTDHYEEVISYIVENQEKFYRLAYSYVRKKEDALDIVQNAICKALENYEELRNVNAVRTWFYRILVNESITYIRRYGIEVSIEEPEILVEQQQLSGTGGVVADRGDFSSLYKEIATLPIDLQMILKLRYFEELQLSEIAEVMNLNINAVKAKLYRGLKKIKLEMGETDIWES